MQAEIQEFVFPVTNHVTRIVDVNGEPWWVAKDICEVLGLGNTGQVLSRLDDDEKNTIILNDGNRGNPNAAIVNESGLYSLILSSRKPEAKTFKKWVTSEVLPSIRKTGSYNTQPVEPQQFLSDPASLRGLLLNYTEKVIALEAKVAEQAPKVHALERLEMSDGSMCPTNAAKVLKVRPKDLFMHLQASKWLYKRPGTSTWIGYQDKIQLGLVEMSEYTQTMPDGTERVRAQARITGKGLAKLSFELNAVDSRAN
jgi:prophage antirepressor-like protein